MTDKGTAAKVVEIALAEVGYIEGPKDNETKYGAFTKANYLPWCGSFVMWVCHQAGVKIPNTVSTMAGAAGFKKLGSWSDAHNADPKPGDIVYFDFMTGGAPIEHVGIVVKNNGDGTIQCIEGNTAGSSKGDQRNGGMVCEKTRAYVKDNKKKLINGIVGWGRPLYKGEEGQPLAVKLAKPAAKPAKKAAKKAAK